MKTFGSPSRFLFAVGLLSLAVAIAPLRAGETNSYLPDGKPDAIALLAPPPLPNSAEQAADLAEVAAVYHACTTNETAAAFAERKFSVFNFTPAIGTFFQPGKFLKTEAFFQRVYAAAGNVTRKAKNHWKRPRPFVVDPSLASGQLEEDFSYPSGHSTVSTVLALLLAELFPNQQEDIIAISRNIGWHRVEIARHYPTDIYAGRVLARAIVRELKASASFQHDFAEVKAEIAAAHVANSCP